MNKIKLLLSICLLPLLMVFPFHVHSSPAPAEVGQVRFDPALANKEFDRIASSLASHKTSIKRLNQAIGQLKALSDQAQECIEDTSEKIKDIDDHLETILGKGSLVQGKKNKIQAKESVSQSRVDSQYLNQQKKKLTQTEAKCRLFVIRAHEVLTVYRNKVLELQQEITFTRGYPIFKRVEMTHKDIQNLTVPEFTSPAIPWGWLNISLFFTALAMLAFALVYCIREILKKFVRRRAIGFSVVLLTFFAIFITTIWLIGYQPFVEEADNVLFQKILIEFLLIVLALLVTKFVVAIRHFDIGLKWYGFDPGFLSRLVQTIILISGIQVLGTTSLAILESDEYLKQFFDSIMMMVSLLATAYFAYYFYIKHQRFFPSSSQFLYINQFIWLIIFTLIALDMTGYYILAVNAANVFYSLLFVGGLSLVLLKGLGQAYHFLNYAPGSQAFLKRCFGYPYTPPHFELALLKGILQVIIVISLLYLFALLIGEASYFIDNFLDYIVQGFIVADYSVKPIHWLVGLLAFCVIAIFSRYISRRYALKNLTEEEEDTQVALASLLLYIGFAVAVIMGLLVSGFSFTSLAIIAGALSVGIGLGLQSIVNNFFSGLILLIEKPIKVGDRIAIGQIEGFVKKVRVRSTQIETPAKEDILVPNSDFITEQVTNFMFTNRAWRVKCAIGVAYGSDTELVRQVLLEVARNHKDVLNGRGNKPLVFFQSFGDSALMFELWCMINNVNKKYVVSSDLNFAIDKAFRAHNIVIAFPQRDVHIKYDPPEKPE